MNLLIIISSSLLAHVYRNNLLSNHKLIRLKRFISQFTGNLWKPIFRLYLIRHACVQTLMCLMCKIFDGELNKTTLHTYLIIIIITSICTWKFETKAQKVPKKWFGWVDFAGQFSQATIVCALHCIFFRLELCTSLLGNFFRLQLCTSWGISVMFWLEKRSPSCLSLMSGFVHSLLMQRLG